MPRVSFFIFLTLVLSACAPKAGGSSENMRTPQTVDASALPASLPDLGPAPELTNQSWINVDAPLRLANLRGKVVLLDMWTFGCINCQHILPALNSWHTQYADKGLIIIGNHYPEFDYEANLENLKKAVADDGIRFAVAQDNDGATWQAYKNQYWPTIYLIDKRGHLRYVHIGEGSYEETESAFKALLSEPVSSR